MKKHVFVVLSSVLILSYFYFNFIATFNENIVPVPMGEKKLVQFFLPQGWGFFTRNPREPKYALYQLLDDRSIKLVSYKITSKANAFGLSKKGNRISMEVSRIKIKSLPDESNWDSSHLNVEDYVKAIDVFEEIDPISGVNYIHSGTYVIKKYDITPWNWIKYPENYDNDFLYYPFTIK